MILFLRHVWCTRLISNILRLEEPELKLPLTLIFRQDYHDSNIALLNALRLAADLQWPQVLFLETNQLFWQQCPCECYALIKQSEKYVKWSGHQSVFFFIPYTCTSSWYPCVCSFGWCTDHVIMYLRGLHSGYNGITWQKRAFRWIKPEKVACSVSSLWLDLPFPYADSSASTQQFWISRACAWTGVLLFTKCKGDTESCRWRPSRCSVLWCNS